MGHDLGDALFGEPDNQELDLSNSKCALLSIQCDPVVFKWLENLLQLSIVEHSGGCMYHNVVGVDGNPWNAS